MYAARINNFLHSMAKSCDVYSQEASEERQRLRAVTADYKVLGKAVHRTLNVVSRDKARAGRPHPSRVRRLNSSRKKSEPPTPPPEEVVVRPAPFPVKNYIIPAKQLVGPRRFFRSRAAQRRREEEIAELQEHQRWPETTERVGTHNDITLVLTTMPTPACEVIATSPRS
jgi:hypothetical protein